MECPNPQPGHQVIPTNFNGHKEKCDSDPGAVKARHNIAAIQKTSSKYMEKSFLINLVRFVMKQQGHGKGQQYANQ